jgi:hypothetical protein
MYNFQYKISIIFTLIWTLRVYILVFFSLYINSFLIKTINLLKSIITTKEPNKYYINTTKVISLTKWDFKNRLMGHEPFFLFAFICWMHITQYVVWFITNSLLGHEGAARKGLVTLDSEQLYKWIVHHFLSKI